MKQFKKIPEGELLWVKVKLKFLQIKWLYYFRMMDNQKIHSCFPILIFSGSLVS